MKNRAYRLTSLALLGGLVSFLLLMGQSAHAFKIHTHVWLADQLAQEIIESDGYVEIQGRSYKLDDLVSDAIQADRGAFVMGTLGADIYPDMFAGQMTTHPGVNKPGAWQTDDWIKFVVTSAFNDGSHSAIAFAAGYMLHAAMDTWAHSYVNLYTGNLFMIVENSEIADRHVALESYLAKFHLNLRSQYPNSVHNDIYAQMQAPTEFVRKTLILNPYAAAQYAKDYSTGTVYYSAIYAYYREAKRARDKAQALAAMLNNELSRIDPLLNQLPGLKAKVDAAQTSFDVHLNRLAATTSAAIDFFSQGAEAGLEALGLDVDLDEPAERAKTALDVALQAYQNVTNQIGYTVEGAYDPDVIRAHLRRGINLAGQGAVGQWPHNIEQAVDAWIVAWEDTGREIMRPHDLIGRNTLGPLTQWTKCWGPVLMPLPVPAQVPQGCDALLSTTDHVATEIALAKEGLIGMLPGGHSILGAMEELRATSEEAVQEHATNALDLIGGIVDQNAIAAMYPDLPNDPTGLASWLVRMWDKNTTMADLDRAFTQSHSIPNYIQQRISPAINRELNICENPNVVAPTYKDAPFRDYAPVQNAVTMSKLALLNSVALNQLVNDLMPATVVKNQKAKTAQGGAMGSGVQVSDDVHKLMRKRAYTSSRPMGAAMIGAIRSIDGDHQWMPSAPPLPRINGQFLQTDLKCRRFGYAPNGSYWDDGCDDQVGSAHLGKKTGFVLYQEPYREAVFNKLFMPIAPQLCNYAGYDHTGASCASNSPFPVYPAVATRATQTVFNRSKQTTTRTQSRQTQSRQNGSRQSQSRQTQSRQTQSRQTQQSRSQRTASQQKQARTQAGGTRTNTTQARERRKTPTARSDQSNKTATARNQQRSNTVSRPATTQRQQSMASRTQSRTSAAATKNKQASRTSQLQADRNQIQRKSGNASAVKQNSGKQLVRETSKPKPERAKRPPPSRTPPQNFLAFNAAAETFDWRNAYLMSLLSWVVYPGVTGPEQGPVLPAALYAQLRRWQLNPVAWVDKTTHGLDSGSTQFFAATTNDALIISFQGSTMSVSDLGQDWIDNDLDMLPQGRSQWGRGVVLHDGFIDAAKIVFPQVKNIIEQHGQGKKIWITGHSLGGALAVLNAMYVEKEMRRQVQGVYVYGAPPVGNARWASSYDAAVPNTHRWSLENDPVTAMMLQIPGTPFRHVGERHNLTDSGVRLDTSVELTYDFERGAGGHLFADLSGTHMDYWCRLNDEAKKQGQRGLPEPPRANCRDICAW